MLRSVASSISSRGSLPRREEAGACVLMSTSSGSSWAVACPGAEVVSGRLGAAVEGKASVLGVGAIKPGH